jgi:hypothetical protein
LTNKIFQLSGPYWSTPREKIGMAQGPLRTDIEGVSRSSIIEESRRELPYNVVGRKLVLKNLEAEVGTN